MPELNIHLQIDPATGKKNLIIEYESDSDSLPHEHEEDHREVIDALIEGGALRAEEIGKVVVRRESAQVPASEGEQDPEANDEPESVDQGQG